METRFLWTNSDAVRALICLGQRTYNILGRGTFLGIAIAVLVMLGS